MASQVTQMKKNVKSEWQIAYDDFKKSKDKDLIFITTFLTPEDADYLLEENDHNRHLNPNLVKRYVRFMMNDEWRLNGECIKISSDGVLMDGQHRLSALKETGKSIQMSVVIGVNPDTFTVNDTGRSRDAGDILKIAGYKNVNQNAAATRWLLWYQSSENFASHDTTSPAQVLKSIKRWPHIVHFVYPAVAVKGMCSYSFIQFFMYATQTINPDLSYEFFLKLETGENLGKTSSILILRNTLLKYRSKNLQLDKRHVAAAFIIAWNAFVEQTRIKTVLWDGGPFPVITGINRKKLFKPKSGLTNVQFED